MRKAAGAPAGRWGRGMVRGLATGGVGLMLGITLSAQPLRGQTSLADYDYENLTFRGFSLEGGYIFPSRVDPTYTVGMRVDLGYLGPGLRIVPGVAFWSSTMKDREVSKLERKVDALILDQGDPGSEFEGVDLGEIDWSDLVLSLDGHFVWSLPYDLLSFAGAGLSAHIMDGDGDAISGTFVEDLLDSVGAGLNLHLGLEYPLLERFRIYGLARYELMSDLRYGELRLGGQIMLSPPAPGEERTR